MSCLQREYHLFQQNKKTTTESTKHIAQAWQEVFPQKKLHKKARTEMRNYFQAKTQHPNNMKKKKVFL